MGENSEGRKITYRIHWIHKKTIETYALLGPHFVSFCKHLAILFKSEILCIWVLMSGHLMATLVGGKVLTYSDFFVFLFGSPPPMFLGFFGGVTEKVENISLVQVVLEL